MATESKATTFTEKLTIIRDSCKIFRVNKGKNYSYYKLGELMDVVEPLLKEHGMRYEYSCDLVPVQHRAFLKTTVMITDGKESAEQSVFHELPEAPGVMSFQQADNASSTFGRKLALEMLLHVDVEDPVDNIAREQGSMIPRIGAPIPKPNF